MPPNQELVKPPGGVGGWRPLVGSSAVACGVALLVGVGVNRWFNDPNVYFLRSENSAEWIRLDQPFVLSAYPSTPTGLRFARAFRTSQPVTRARLVVRAFRRCVVQLDGATLYVGPEDLGDWLEPREVGIPDWLRPGEHVLQITVLNRDAQPCLLAYCEELGLRTGPGWIVEQPDRHRSPAISVTQRTQPEVALTYPSVAERAGRLAPYLFVIFAAAFAWSFWNKGESRWRIRPGALRWGLFAAWVVMALNNLWQVNWRLGFDMARHFDYVQYIAQHHALPLANQGLEMFQPPLFYLLEAPVYWLLSSRYEMDVIVRVLRFLPLLCGLAQIEIVYRAARLVFPGKDDLQKIALVVGGLCPVNIYVSQAIGNEPLAGTLTALAVLLCLSLLVERDRVRTWRFFVVLGLVWGLAILSKVTPLLLAPLVVSAVAVYCRTVLPRNPDGAWGPSLGRAGVVCGVCGLTAGWFFLRNLAHFGKPFVANWDPVSGFAWWQEPGYRTWSQLLSFGTSLSRPIYGGIWSLWDALYSSLWLDGFVSGRISPAAEFPWNLSWVLWGAWLGLVPTALVVASPATCWRREFDGTRKALGFCLAAVVVYLIAVADFFVRVPIYTTANARFLLGLLPCLAVLAAAGAAPLMRFRLLRAILFATLACWAVAAYAAYFDVDAIRGLLLRSP